MSLAVWFLLGSSHKGLALSWLEGTKSYQLVLCLPQARGERSRADQHYCRRVWVAPLCLVFFLSSHGHADAAHLEAASTPADAAGVPCWRAPQLQTGAKAFASCTDRDRSCSSSKHNRQSRRERELN